MKRRMIELALSNGWQISVEASEDCERLLRKSTDVEKIVDAVESVDRAEVYFYSASGQLIGSASIVNGLAEDEEIADYSWNPEVRNLMAEVFAGHPDHDLF